MERKRVNISIDPQTYNQLEKVQRRYRFANVCELVSAMVFIMLDYIAKANEKKILDIPEDDAQYIGEMFRELEDYELTPARTAPPQQRRRHIDKAAALNTDNRNKYYNPERDGPPATL